MSNPYDTAKVIASADTPLRVFVEDVFWPAKATLRGSTRKGYIRDLRNILPVLGEVPLRDVRHLAIQEMVSACSTTKMGKNARQTLSAVLSFACDIEVLDINHARGRFRYPDVLPGEKADDQGVVLETFEEIHEFLSEMRRSSDGGVLERGSLLGLGCGHRKGEIFGTDGPDMNFRTRLASVRRTYVDDEDDGGFILLPPKTRNSIRDVPFFDYVYRRLAKLEVGSGPFIVNRFGERQNPESASKMLAKWRDRTGAPGVTFGSMRHSFATACIEAGIPVADLARWLGHSDPEVTLKSYVRPTMKSLRKDTRVIDDRFCGATRGEFERVASRITPEERDFAFKLAS